MKKSTQSLGLRIFYALVILLVTGVAIAGLIVLGSPDKVRARRADELRVQDLQQISYAIDLFWTRNAHLPEGLDELQNARDIYISSIQDPETGIPYDFHQLKPDQYELCATFTDVSQDLVSGQPVKPGSTFWQHDAGITCFTLDAHNPTQAPPAPTVVR